MQHDGQASLLQMAKLFVNDSLSTAKNILLARSQSPSAVRSPRDAEGDSPIFTAKYSVCMATIITPRKLGQSPVNAYDFLNPLIQWTHF